MKVTLLLEVHVHVSCQIRVKKNTPKNVKIWDQENNIVKKGFVISELQQDSTVLNIYFLNIICVYLKTI